MPKRAVIENIEPASNGDVVVQVLITGAGRWSRRFTLRCEPVEILGEDNFLGLLWLRIGVRCEPTGSPSWFRDVVLEAGFDEALGFGDKSRRPVRAGVGSRTTDQKMVRKRYEPHEYPDPRAA